MVQWIRMSWTTTWFIFHFRKIQNGYISPYVGRKGKLSGKRKGGESLELQLFLPPCSMSNLSLTGNWHLL